MAEEQPNDTNPSRQPAAPASGGFPLPITGNPRRQAVPSIRGTVYQAWRSIDAWLRLKDDQTAIYLEGAEDFDIVTEGSAITVQVRNTSQSISLGSKKAITALEEFWKLAASDEERRIELHYLTTSSVATEADARFQGLAGIDAWRIAKTDLEVSRSIATYLCEKLEEDSTLRKFVKENSPNAVQEGLVRRVHWLVDQPGLEAIKRSVDERISALLAEQSRPSLLIEPIRQALESHFWEVLVRPELGSRRLTLADLRNCIYQATHTYLPIPIEQLHSLISAARPGHGLLEMLLRKVPKAPSPLLHRPALTDELCRIITQREAVLVSGSVFKGKTTLVQMAAERVCPNAWWVTLSERPTADIDLVLLALSQRIEEGAAPEVIIIDDLDVSRAAVRIYQSSLDLLVQRTYTSGRGLVLTARGASQSTTPLREASSIHVLSVGSLSEEDLATACSTHGCPTQLVKMWSFEIAVSTGGHPKLAQVRLHELMRLGWPRPKMSDFFGASPAVRDAREMARELLAETESAPTASLVYLMAEASVPLRLQTAILLSETVPELANGGDVIAKLKGNWLEQVEGGRLRVTALLKNAASVVWSPERRQNAHGALCDVFDSEKSLFADEAASMLFHAYLSGDQGRIARSALKLQITVKDAEVARQVHRHLQWLTWVALEPGERISEDPHTATILRSMQFRVASSTESESLPKICARWREDLERIEIAEFGPVARAMWAMSIGFSTARVPLNERLRAILEAPNIPPEIAEPVKMPSAISGISSERVEPLHAMLILCTTSVKGLEALRQFSDWLSDVAPERVLRALESVIDWPIVQQLGAYVQSAWTHDHEATHDWAPWLSLFEKIQAIAISKGLSGIGREAAKAQSLVLTEYLHLPEQGMSKLDDAIEKFGSSTILLEQKANVLFQSNDDGAVLRTWEQLTNSGSNLDLLGPFAYRRIAISAARLSQWELSRDLFLRGATTCDVSRTYPTKFGLTVDAAYVIAQSGHFQNASDILLSAFSEIRVHETDDGGARWEAAIRVASEVCQYIERRLSNRNKDRIQIHFGWSSSPNLIMPEAQPGQVARNQLLQASILKLAAIVGTRNAEIDQRIGDLLTSEYAIVRLVAAEARLAREYQCGPSDEFLQVLSAFDQALRDFSAFKRSETSVLEAFPAGSIDSIPLHGAYASLVVAATVCVRGDLVERLEKWAASPDAGSPLRGSIRNLLRGAEQPIDSLEGTVRDPTGNPYLRLGAAARLLLAMPPADLALQMQAFLISGMATNEALACQLLWNAHVAHCFAEDWAELSNNAFQFNAPRLSLPPLIAAVGDVRRGSGTLRELLQTAHDALGRALPSFFARLF